jgi:hypothetical protein
LEEIERKRREEEERLRLEEEERARKEQEEREKREREEAARQAALELARQEAAARLHTRSMLITRDMLQDHKAEDVVKVDVVFVFAYSSR